MFYVVYRIKIYNEMMNTQELNDYTQSFIKEEGSPKVLQLKRGSCYANAPKTSDRKPKGGISWIDYYRAFTDPTQTVFECVHCGKTISTDDDIIDMNDDVYEAFGGHILVGDMDKKSPWYYIVPVCQDCNTPDKILHLKKDIPTVEEVAATIIKNNK